MTDKNNSSSPCHVLRLPLEIRRMIYHLMWDEDSESTWDLREKGFPPAISSVFPELEQECLSVFFEHCVVHISLDINDPKKV